MSTSISSTSWPNQRTSSFNILGKLDVEIEVEQNPYALPLDSLFGMAGRINKKRGFLFVSKVLGKHIPVVPGASMLSGALLGARLLEVCYGESVDVDSLVEAVIDQEQSRVMLPEWELGGLDLPQRMIFIGFAETATGLGHSVFGCFRGDAYYIHTTREDLRGMQPVITFEEEHSHAVAHRFYPQDDAWLRTDAPIVLVDDEITTGKTALNIIREIQKKYPRQEYIVASLLDWRSDEDCQKFADLQAELGIQIKSVSLVKGQIRVKGSPVEGDSAEHEHGTREQDKERVDPLHIHADITLFPKKLYESIDTTGFVNSRPYLQQTGRFGMESREQADLQANCRKLGLQLRDYRSGKSLCLGTGEFMYIPMMISAYMGDEVWFQSSTRSPIYPADSDQYAIQNAFFYESPDDPIVRNFCYNIPANRYDDLFVFMERRTSQKRLRSFFDVLDRLPIPRVNIVFFS